MKRIIAATRSLWSNLKQRSAADEKWIINEAKREFGHFGRISAPINAANTLPDLSVALRGLAHVTAVSSPSISGQAIAYARSHGISGLHPEDVA